MVIETSAQTLKLMYFQSAGTLKHQGPVWAPLAQSVRELKIPPDLSAFTPPATDITVKCVFVTENETNFLTFPQVRDAIVIFGAGYGWEALARSHWMNKCIMYYWGDIDTHGFGILDQLRSHFDHVDSFLMDRATLDAHTMVWSRNT